MKIHILVAKQTSLQSRLHNADKLFVDFVKSLLEIDPLKRPSAKEALQHPFMTATHYVIDP